MSFETQVFSPRRLYLPAVAIVGTVFPPEAEMVSAPGESEGGRTLVESPEMEEKAASEKTGKSPEPAETEDA
jgi:hypothetical protein